MDVPTQDQHIPNLTQIKEFLEVPPGHRPRADVRELCYLVEGNKFLNKFKETGALEKLCQYITLEQYRHNDVIFEQGDEGDIFYIILYGHVLIHKVSESVITGVRNYEKLAQLQEGDSFGEISIMMNAKRQAQAMWKIPSGLFVIPRDVYIDVVKGAQLEKVAENYDFLKSFMMFGNVKKDTVMSMARILGVRRYGSNQIVFKQHDAPEGIFFIQSGTVNLTRHITDFGFDKVIDVNQVGKNQAIGDYEVLKGKKMRCTATTMMPCTMMFANRADVNTLGSSQLMDFNKMMKPFLQDEELIGNYIKDQRWNFYKRKMSQNVHVGKFTKAFDFNQSLRKPNLQLDKSLESPNSKTFKKWSLPIIQSSNNFKTLPELELLSNRRYRSSQRNIKQRNLSHRRNQSFFS